MQILFQLWFIQNKAKIEQREAANTLLSEALVLRNLDKNFYLQSLSLRLAIVRVLYTSAKTRYKNQRTQ